MRNPVSRGVNGRLLAGVGDGDGLVPGLDLGDDLVVLDDVDLVRALGADNLATRRRRGRAGELDLAEVGERHEAARGEVLDNPLRVELTERGLARERVRDGLSGRLVRDRRRAARLRGGGDGHLDRVADLEADAREVVGTSGEPLVPCWRAKQVISGQVGHEKGRELTAKANIVAVHVEVETGLEDGVAASVAVDTNPGGGIVLAGRARGLLRPWDDEGTSDGLVSRLMRKVQQ